VVADAVYSTPDERSDIEAVASSLGVPFRGLWLTAKDVQLVARIAARRNDASDATPNLVADQQSCLEPGQASTLAQAQMRRYGAPGWPWAADIIN
jgi:predicted kinase